jgi:hypothetical protein
VRPELGRFRRRLNVIASHRIARMRVPVRRIHGQHRLDDFRVCPSSFGGWVIAKTPRNEGKVSLGLATFSTPQDKEGMCLALQIMLFNHH